MSIYHSKMLIIIKIQSILLMLLQGLSGMVLLDSHGRSAQRLLGQSLFTPRQSGLKALYSPRVIDTNTSMALLVWSGRVSSQLRAQLDQTKAGLPRVMWTDQFSD